MAPDRARGAEYKALAKGEIRGFSYEPERGRIDGPQWIAGGIAKKTAKNYAGAGDLNLNLLVYADFSARQLQYAEVLAAARPHLATFASVWVVTSLWLGSLYVSNGLRRIDGWCTIFTPEEYAADEAG